VHQNKIIGAHFACDGTTSGVSPFFSRVPFVCWIQKKNYIYNMHSKLQIFNFPLH